MIKWGNYGLATTLEGGYVKIKSKGVEGPMLESKYLAHPVELMQVQEQEIEE